MLDRKMNKPKATGLSNVELKQASILDFNESYGKFDYIIFHGVFSWVERNIKQKILQVSNSHLSPTGVAYISYNTYPGWHI
jgi:SAM-dependent methyltransferase